MRTFDLNQPLTAHALNESMFKKFNVKVNFDKYTREDLENYRNLLRTKVNHTEAQANFNDLLSHETYQKDKYMLTVLNTKIKEMLGEGMKVGDKKKSSTGGTIEKTKTGIKHTAGKNYGAEKQPWDEKKSKKAAILDKDIDEGKKAKPDFLDMDKDGNKKEPMKKAVADKKAGPKKGVNPFAKVKEATKPLKGGQKKLDTDKDGDIDAKDMKNLRSKKSVKESKSDLMHQAYQQYIAEGIAYYIAEDEEGKAKSITAASDMLNDFTSWMQRVGNYQTKSMIELADNIRANFDMQTAETFKQAVGEALGGALEALTQARETINNAVAVLAGEAPAEEPMGMDSGMDMDVGDEGMPAPAEGDDLNLGGDDEFSASDAAAGGPETTGRMKRESIERQNRLMRILGS
jgi:hypothetical protein